ncbi:MAG: hypothetical protein WBC71_14025 [Salaquimonas sp.]
MNGFKKSVIALATIATLSATAIAPAHAGSKHWKRGLAAGVGVGVGLGIAGALLAPRHRTVIVQQPTYYVRRPRCELQNEPLFDRYGRVVAYQQVRVCY